MNEGGVELLTLNFKSDDLETRRRWHKSNYDDQLLRTIKTIHHADYYAIKLLVKYGFFWNWTDACMAHKTH